MLGFNQPSPSSRRLGGTEPLFDAELGLPLCASRWHARVMSDGTRTIPAKISRLAEDGSKETVTGSLTISDDSPTHLITLSEDFPSDQPDVEAFFSGVAEVDVQPLLHLETQDGFFTAIDSRMLKSRRNFGGSKLSEIVLRPSFVIKGTALLWEHELKITHANVRFWHQDDWAEWEAWGLTRSDPKEGNSLTLERLNIDPLVSSVDGVIVKLADNSPFQWNARNRNFHLESKSIFEIRFEEELPLRTFMTDWLRPLSFLVSSGVRQTAGVDFMSIHNSNWISDLDGQPMSEWLDVVPRNPSRKVAAENVGYLHILRHFDFGAQLQTVFDAFRAHGPSIEQYLDFIHYGHQSPMVRLTVLAQLVETFDRSLKPDPPVTEALVDVSKKTADLVAADEATRKFSKDAERVVIESVRPTLSSRLSRMDKEVGGLMSKVLGSKGWKTDIPLVRNTVVHGLERGEFFTTNVIPLEIAEDILNLLFEMRLLVEFGFTPDQVEQMITKDDPNWWRWRERVTKYLPAFVLFKDYGK